MRLYTPVKLSSPGEEESDRDSSVTRRDRTFHYDSRPAHRTTENNTPHDDKLTQREDNSSPLHLARLQDSLPFKSPLREGRLGGQPAHATSEVNGGGPSKQNGADTHDLSPALLQNGADTICSLDSVPWNLDGIETIKENGCKWSLEAENGEDTHGLSDETEIQLVKEENKRLKTALKEAAEVNGQWREYHEQRQKYVQRLLTALHDLQHPRSAAHSPRQQLEVETGGSEGETRRLREELTRQQASHDEHVALLEMQVRAHRDDWEAERSEKQATQTALAEAQARTALLLQELQLLQAKLVDSESKRGLCWRCAAPRTSNPPSAAPSAHASPVPAPSASAAPSPSPGPVVSPTPLQEPPQAPLKGWIPVSMLHQIAFSGATPEHQTPVVQRPLTPSRGISHHHSHHRHHHPSRPTSLDTSGAKQSESSQQEGAGLSGGRGGEASPRRNATPDKVSSSSAIEEKKRYEAMGARPKVLGNLQAVSGKGGDLLEDEKSAKHRARSILANALPMSPVSGGPPTPFGPGVMKSPSTPNMPKGYVPITSTVLTPINFRPPFVAHKRPSTIKQNALHGPSSPSSSTPKHTRSGSSPASISGVPSTSTSGNPPTTSPAGDTLASSQQSTSQAGDRAKAQTSAKQENNAMKTHSGGHKMQDRLCPQERKRSTVATVTSSSSSSSFAAATNTTTFSTHSTTNTTVNTTSTSTTTTTSVSCSCLTTTTTTLSSSSPVTATTTSPSSTIPRACTPHGSGSCVSAGHGRLAHPANSTESPQQHPNSAFQPVAATRVASFPPSSSTRVTLSTASDAKELTVGSGSGISWTSPRSNNSSPLSPPSAAQSPSPATTTAARPCPPQPSVSVTSHSSAASTTAFAAITVTTIAATNVHVPPAPSTYSSTTSSRSSSPGISLTTFGLNSEGRGIPGAIFFALGPEQRGGKSPQPGASSRRASNSSAGVKSPTPEPAPGGHTSDSRPPVVVKSPPLVLSRSAAPPTVREEHWWSVEGGGRSSAGGGEGGGGRQQQQQQQQQGVASGRLVNSTWVRLMGSRADGRQSSGLPWRTARAVSGQTLKQARRTPQEEPADGSVSPGSASSTATFNYTPAVNSPPSSALSSTTNSASSSPLPSLNQRDDLKSLASKNIASAIMSYELNTKCESVGGATHPTGCSSESAALLTRKDLVCPSCQMLFPPDKHALFLDHFEACRGPEYADL